MKVMDILLTSPVKLVTSNGEIVRKQQLGVKDDSRIGQSRMGQASACTVALSHKNTTAKFKPHKLKKTEKLNLNIFIEYYQKPHVDQSVENLLKNC